MPAALPTSSPISTHCRRTSGPTYAADLSFLIVRHDGRKALVVLNESWKEEVFELTKTKDGWTVKVVGGWIS